MRALAYRIYVVFIFLLLITHKINAQISKEILHKKVDSILENKLDPKSPGSAVLVVKDGQILLNKGYGMANLEHGVPISTHTVFDIASLSKQFTGFAISTLIEQKKLSPEDDIRKYIPELPDFGTKITIAHLVHHTSGIRDWTSTLKLAGWKYHDIITFDQIIRMACNQNSLNFIPGEEYSYTNTGYNLLAELVQRVTGESFRTWTQKNIFEPLKMTNTHFFDNHNEVIKNKADSYYRDPDNNYHKSINNLSAMGSSSLYMTTDDLAKWVINLENKKIGGKAVINRMFQTSTLSNGDLNSYAYGLWIDSYRQEKRISHSGSWASFKTYLTYFPNKNLSIIVLNNNNRSAEHLTLTIANLFIPKDTPIDTEKENKIIKEVAVDTNILKKYVGTYKFGTSWYVDITLLNGKLMTRATYEDACPMIPISKSSFWVNAYEEEIKFNTDKNGKVISIGYKGKDRPKVKDRTDSGSKHPLEYVGTYKSDELKTIFTVEVEGHQIWLDHFRIGKTELFRVYDDDFLVANWLTDAIVFLRDKNNNVIGFIASDERARNQKFMKIND